MYSYKFTDIHRDIKTGKTYLMSEQDTLEELLLNEFELDIDEFDKVPELFRAMSPKEWAEYAFKNNKDYIVTYDKENKIYAIVDHSDTHICINFYEEKNDKSIKNYLGIQFIKGTYKEIKKKKVFIPFKENVVFLLSIDWYSEYGKGLLFYPEKKKDNTFLEEWIEEDGKPVLVEQWGTADLSKHWFEAPKHFLDFERFLDYKSLLEPEYYKKEAEIPPKPDSYKIHEGKEYTKEEWQQYQEEKRKNARPGTTWSLLED